MPKVSVLMPVYNTKSEYLKEAVESILNQTFTDFELLIMDDGSTQQDTLDLLEFYKSLDTRIKVFYEKHVGLVKIRNKLLEQASGEYIAIMDSDDISLPNRLEKEVDFLDNNRDISVVGSWYECFPQYQIIKTLPYPKILNFVNENRIGNSTSMFRRKEFEKYNLKYDEKYKIADDYGLWANAIFNLKFANIQEVLVKYRVHPNNITHTKAKLQQNDTRAIKQMLLDSLINKEFQNKLLNLIYSLDKPKINYTFWQRFFSIKNIYPNGTKFKIITILGIKIKIKKAKSGMSAEKNPPY